MHQRGFAATRQRPSDEGDIRTACAGRGAPELRELNAQQKDVNTTGSKRRAHFDYAPGAFRQPEQKQQSSRPAENNVIINVAKILKPVTSQT